MQLHKEHEDLNGSYSQTPGVTILKPNLCCWPVLFQLRASGQDGNVHPFEKPW
jgi:hypothetical protein